MDYCIYLIFTGTYVVTSVGVRFRHYNNRAQDENPVIFGIFCSHRKLK